MNSAMNSEANSMVSSINEPEPRPSTNTYLPKAMKGGNKTRKYKGGLYKQMQEYYKN